MSLLRIHMKLCEAYRQILLLYVYLHYILRVSASQRQCASISHVYEDRAELHADFYMVYVKLAMHVLYSECIVI